MAAGIKKLKEYFEKRDDVAMAFVFGSQARKRAGKVSDWDIACYLKPSLDAGVEWENNRDYPAEKEIWNDLVDILETDNVDLIILNRAPASIAASSIQGLPLVIKDRRLYLEFMLTVTREAEDYYQTVQEYADIYWRSKSLNEEDRNILQKRLIFLDSELKDIDKFRNLTQVKYERDSMKRRGVERWIENLINATIDISKTILASEKRPVPSSYKEILRTIGSVPDFPEDLASQLADWAAFRNILAHEYLDIRWKRIEDFIKKSEPYLRKFLEIVQNKLKSR